MIKTKINYLNQDKDDSLFLYISDKPSKSYYLENSQTWITEGNGYIDKNEYSSTTISQDNEIIVKMIECYHSDNNVRNMEHITLELYNKSNNNIIGEFDFLFDGFNEQNPHLIAKGLYYGHEAFIDFSPEAFLI